MNLSGRLHRLQDHLGMKSQFVEGLNKIVSRALLLKKLSRRGRVNKKYGKCPQIPKNIFKYL